MSVSFASEYIIPDFESFEVIEAPIDATIEQPQLETLTGISPEIRELLALEDRIEQDRKDWAWSDD